jgi:Ca2+-binding RTX toxin-like protein
MPPQVGKAGEGGRSIPTNTVESSQEVKSSEVGGKKTPEQKESAKNDSVPRRASSKEASSRKTELAVGGASQQSTLNQKLQETRENPIVIQGTAGEDNVHISRAKGLAGQLGLIEVNVNGNKQMLTGEQAKRLEIRTGQGNDTVVIDSGVKQGIKVDGGSGNDVLIGGGGDDFLSGGKGNDVIFGRGGNDLIKGGRGNDTLHGGKRGDIIIDDQGKNSINGGPGIDLIIDKPGKNKINSE